MKLTYYVSERYDDNTCYSVRAKTKRECLYQRNSIAGTPDAKAKDCVRSDWGASFGPVVKTSVEYDDGFELLVECMAEGGGWWEARSSNDAMKAFGYPDTVEDYD